jgi:seryl-tRNA synthetase
MLDSKYLRYDIDGVTQKLKTRGFALDTNHFLQLENQRKTLQETVQTLQAHSNAISQKLGRLKRNASQDENSLHEIEQALEKSREIKAELHEKMAAFEDVRQKLDDFLLGLPNLPDETVPVGQTSEDNVIIRQWGELPSFKFLPKDHVDLMANHSTSPALDFEHAAQMTGGRFAILRGDLAKLNRALIQFMLDIHTKEHGYEEVVVPYIVNRTSLEGTGQLPGFESDLFRLHTPDHFYLIPTGEVPLTNLARNRIFTLNELPQKQVSYTACFRSEAGSYGRDVKGIIRQHQFEKVELVQFVTAEQAENALEHLTKAAETILQRLELPYRVALLCTGDLGFGAAKTYDIEVWLPGQNTFREISSCSHMGTFQARRLKARWRCPKTKKLEWIHTLNGSGLAVGRTLVAILENYQKADGSIQVPKALQPYMGTTLQISP